MKFRPDRQNDPQPGQRPAARPVVRERAEKIQLQAEELGKAAENKGKFTTSDDIARRQQKAIEQHMAQLRRETVQARQLAQHIDNLSQDVAVLKRKRGMTDSNTIDPPDTRAPRPRSGDRPRVAEKPRSFNPLHPSMELPPEELIRLLGLESKKIRKRRKKAPGTATARAKSPAPAAKAATTTVQNALPDTLQTTAPEPRSKTRRERLDSDTFRERRGHLWLPALAVGLLSGIALSAYLFWWQPAPAEAGKPQPAVEDSKPAAQPAPAARAKTAKARPAPTPKTPAKTDDPAWLSAVDARGAQLRSEAEQRFAQRLQVLTAAPAPGSTTPEPADISQEAPAQADTVPAPDVTPAPSEETPVQSPVSVEDTPSVEQPAAAVDGTTADPVATVPAATPAREPAVVIDESASSAPDAQAAPVTSDLPATVTTDTSAELF